jgi:hypothetical protein
MKPVLIGGLGQPQKTVMALVPAPLTHIGRSHRCRQTQVVSCGVVHDLLWKRNVVKFIWRHSNADWEGEQERHSGREFVLLATIEEFQNSSTRDTSQIITLLDTPLMGG